MKLTTKKNHKNSEGFKLKNKKNTFSIHIYFFYIKKTKCVFARVNYE